MKKPFVLLWIVALLALVSEAQANSNYRVLSLTESEAIVEVTPQFTFDTLRMENGEFVRVLIAGATYDETAGMPMVPQLPLSFLLPAKVSMNVEVIESLTSGVMNMHLLPVPTSTKSGTSISYAIASGYSKYKNREIFTLGGVNAIRTAYSQTIDVSPVRYQAATKSLQLVEKLKLRIRFYGKAPKVDAAAFTRAELDLFHAGFVNGNQSQFYRSAQADAMRTSKLDRNRALKTSAQSTGEWLTIETSAEGGIYRVTAEDLANAGIGTVPNANTIELFGYGGRAILEAITDSSGEWTEVAIDVREDGAGKLTEFYFYVPGIHHWKFQDRTDIPDHLIGLYHTINPYMSSGRLLLKVGGDAVASQARVIQQSDVVTGEVVQSNRVFTGVTREVERSFEIPNFSLEFVGEQIPRQGADALTVNLSSLPAYTPDSTVLRVGFNSTAKASAGTNELFVDVNGRTAATFLGDVGDGDMLRTFDKTVVLTNDFGTPDRVSLSYKSKDPEARTWLNWIDLFYRARTEVGNTSLPFFVIDVANAFAYDFTGVQGGAVWDVTNPAKPIALGKDNGSGSLAVTIQGRLTEMRQVIAYSTQSALRIGGGKISRTTPPQLRATLGQQGTTNIIVAPEVFREQAEDLRVLRERGGEATEAMKTTVVLLEDIYKEFGYGAKDPTAIRDFMAYVYRHTRSNGTTVPMFLTLFGGGHVDNQNRVTELPIRVPLHEISNGESGYITDSFPNKNDPDDGFFVRLTPHTGGGLIDQEVAVGRLSVQTVEEAVTVVSKLKKYETSSDEGAWRARVSMVIDDREYDQPGKDPLPHLEDSEAAIRQIANRIQINKIYGQSYEPIYTSGGRRKPAMETAILEAFNEGSVITSYVGHGNPKVWAHETILQVPTTINKLANLNRLTFVAMATCDFAEYDNYADISGGIMMLTREAGGAVSMLGTSRSVTGGESMYTKFFESLFDVPCESSFGTNNIGTALLVAKLGRTFNTRNPIYFYLQGDPALRLLVPKQYAVIDSINGKSVLEEKSTISALSQVKLSGRISSTCGEIAGIDPSFNGKATITLYDTRTKVYRPTHFSTGWSMVDSFYIDGPILYRGSATVRDGRFTATFIVPRDIKFDTSNAKISVIAYADNRRSALGAYEQVQLAGSDPSQSIDDTTGPELRVFIGTRAFKSGDLVPVNSTVIVDIKDELGLNTSTASIGHSFIGWVDEATDKSVDMAENYVSEQDNFRIGTSLTKMTLPVGRHMLKVRAFDALNNPTFAEVEFVAKDDDPFKIFNATAYPNPVTDHATVSFMHPLPNGSVFDARLDIFTSDGRQMRSIETPNLTGNVVEITWQADDDGGLNASQGAYTYRVTVTDQNDGRTASAFGTLVLVK